MKGDSRRSKELIEKLSMKQLSSKKAQSGFGTMLPLIGLGLGIVVLSIILAVGAQVLGETRDDMTANSTEYNITAKGLTNVTKVNDKVGTIVTVAVLGVILSILIGVVAIFINRQAFA
jgi:hypothetical protein